jgi:hypothetical protein
MSEDWHDDYIAQAKAQGHTLRESCGRVDWFAYDSGHCNGPGCEKCDWSACWHCDGPEDIPKCCG